MEMEQTKVMKKRPREENSSSAGDEGSEQRLIPEAPNACAYPPALVTSNSLHHHESSSSKQRAQSSSKEQPDPKSASVAVFSLPVPVTVSVIPDSTKQTGEESDAVEELLMRALEEELETPNGNASAGARAAALFRDVEEDDNYDESEDDEE